MYVLRSGLHILLECTINRHCQSTCYSLTVIYIQSYNTFIDVFVALVLSNNIRLVGRLGRQTVFISHHSYIYLYWLIFLVTDSYARKLLYKLVCFSSFVH